MNVAFCSEATEEMKIIKIGEKVGIKLDDVKDFKVFLRRVMDKLEGEELYAEDLTVCLAYNFLSYTTPLI